MPCVSDGRRPRGGQWALRGSVANLARCSLKILGRKSSRSRVGKSGRLRRWIERDQIRRQWQRAGPRRAGRRKVQTPRRLGLRIGEADVIQKRFRSCRRQRFLDPTSLLLLFTIAYTDTRSPRSECALGPHIPQSNGRCGWHDPRTGLRGRGRGSRTGLTLHAA